MPEIDERARSSATPEQAFALLADARSWPDWGLFDSASVEPGPSPGVGEVRVLVTGRVRSRERVAAFEPPRLFAYELEKGLPLRDYRAEVTIAPLDGGGSEIRWHSTFRGTLLARLLAPRLRKFIGETVEGLARGAERGTGGR